MARTNHYRCALCRGRYTRRHTVYNHFPGCVRRNGNANGLVWDSDPSCWRRGARGPGPEMRLGSDEWRDDDEIDEVPSQAEELGEDEAAPDMPSSPPALIPAAAFDRIASPEPVPEKKNVLHPFTVMSIASLVIIASKDHAEKGLEEMEMVLALWREMPEEAGTSPVSDNLARDPGARRIAVGVFANRVFASCMRDVDGEHDGLLALASGIRDLAATLGAADAVARIHDLVSEALGNDGPLLL